MPSPSKTAPKTARERLMVAVSKHVKCTHLCWPKGHSEPLPWAAYRDDPTGKGADNENWSVTHHWTVELYEKYPDTSLEDDLFDTLRGAYDYVEPYETTYIESEGCFVTFYRFAEIERM